MFTLTIHTDNAAFLGDPGPEVARILRRTADRIAAGEATGLFQTIFDINGNDVGRFKLGDVYAAEGQ